jgi:hypothetical protein
MLKLIRVNKEKKSIEKENRLSFAKTCKQNCVLYNDELQTCPVFKGLNYEDPNIVKRCLEFTDKKETEKFYNDDVADTIITLIEDQFSVSGELDFLFELNGTNRLQSTDSYPLKPEVMVSDSGDFYWYVSPDETFGCWIKNTSKKSLFAIPANIDEALKGWAKNIYRSPIPLHDHQASKSLRSRMCWYVDEEGWGQYTVIIANEIRFLTYPKPKDWDKRRNR